MPWAGPWRAMAFAPAYRVELATRQIDKVGASAGQCKMRHAITLETASGKSRVSSALRQAERDVAAIR